MSVNKLVVGRRTPEPSRSRAERDETANYRRQCVLEAQHLSKSYGARKAVDDASLRVLAGEGVALLGPNGSGKTTLLCLLAGVLRAGTGSALVCGQPTHKARARRALGFVPQDAAVYDGLTGAENLVLFGRLAGLTGSALSGGVEGALEAAELTSMRDVRAAAYSGGMRRRLSLACALVHAPSVLLLDEPFEGVDDHSRDHLLQVLADSKRRGVALVLSTHRLHEVSALCERFYLLREGRIALERAVSESLADAASQAAPSERTGSTPREGHS